MTPVDIIRRCGFRLASRATGRRLQFVYRRSGLEGEVDRTDLKLLYDTREGSFRAEVVSDGRTLVFETHDLRDITALAISYRNSIEPPDIVARDTFRSMQAPEGSIPLPFHAGGRWATRTDDDGAEHILDPYARWGALYESYRNRWFDAQVGAPMQGAASDYLAAAGFEERSGFGLGTTFHLESCPLQDSLHARDKFSRCPIHFRTWRNVDAMGEDFHQITANSSAISGRWSTLLSLTFTTKDVRDVLAFVASIENFCFRREGSSEELPPERLGREIGTDRSIINYFVPPNFDSDYSRRRCGDALELDHPYGVWGHAYIAWRDRWAEHVLSSGAPTPCGRFSSTKLLPHPVFRDEWSKVVGAGLGVCVYEGGDEQPVAFVDSTGYPQLLTIGRGILEERLGATTDEERVFEKTALEALDNIVSSPIWGAAP